MRETAPSLGDQLARAGVVDRPTLDALIGLLRDRLRNGTPTSLGRLLLERGVPSIRILAAATSGERVTAVRCDACTSVQGVPVPLPTREFPCSRCGALLLPLGPAVGGTADATMLGAPVLPLPAPFTPATPSDNPDPNEDSTMPLAGEGQTARFPGVLPIPAPAPPGGGTTLHFGVVLPIPEALAPQDRVLPAGAEAPTVAISGDPRARGAASGAIGVPPRIHGMAAPPLATPAGAAIGIPPVVHLGAPSAAQEPRGSGSGGRRGVPPPATPRYDPVTESPTVHDREGSGGAFADALTVPPVSAPPPAPSMPPVLRPTAEGRPTSGASRERRRPGRYDKKDASGGSKGLVVALVFLAVVFIALLGAGAYFATRYLLRG
jgi:hypothetical protein